jgi:signal peptide peptidase SppA
MKQHHFLAWALSSPWAMQPERMQAYAVALARIYGAKLGGGTRPQAGDYRDDDDTVVQTPAPYAAVAAKSGSRASGATAVIPVLGTLMQRAESFDLCEGGTAYSSISQALRAANADETIGSILLDVDSPGGSVYGVAELAAEIRASAKPVVAMANSLAASAAYWLAASCTECYVSPGGEVGSIGVWMAHEDWSAAMEEAGVKTTLISAGKYKVEGNPFEPLAGDARDFLQSRTDEYYGAFCRDVAKGRKASTDQVRAGMGQGRVLGASQAKAEGMVDDILTFDDAVRRAQRLGQQHRSANPNGARRADHDQRRTATALRLLELDQG